MSLVDGMCDGLVIMRTLQDPICQRCESRRKMCVNQAAFIAGSAKFGLTHVWNE